MRILFLSIFSLFALVVLPASAQQTRRNDVGTIEVVSGKVQVESDVRSNPIAQVGEALYEGEMITTGADGELHMHLADGGYLAIRPNTMLRFTRYQANGDAEDRALFTLVKGSTRFITGWIAQFNPKAWQIKTPTGSINVRGTDHETWVIPEFDAAGDGGTYDRVYQGRTILTNKAGSIEIGPDKAGYTGLKDRPRLLDRIPGFYRPGRYDDMFEGKHDRLQAALAENRSARIEKLRSIFRDRQLPIGDIKDRPSRIYVPPVGATLPKIESVSTPPSEVKVSCKTVVSKNKNKKEQKHSKQTCLKAKAVTPKKLEKTNLKKETKHQKKITSGRTTKK